MENRELSKVDYWKLIVIALFLLNLMIWSSACTVATDLPKPAPSATQPATPTQFTAATPSPSPTATATLLPSATPFSGLAAPRPWLMLNQDDDQPILIYPQDHSSKLLTLPNGGKIRDIQKAVSPDSNWIAFFTGSHDGPNPTLTLNLLSLRDGSMRTISPVMVKDFPENMRPLAEHMDQITPDDPNGISLSVEGWMQRLESIFPQTVMAVSWSPDSRSLAFSAQIDGPSADVYVYHLDTGEIQRMVNDIDNAYSMEWSPNGKWILYSNNIPGPNYSAKTLSVIRADGPLVHDPIFYQNSPWWFGKGWLSDSQYIITGQGDGGDPYRLQVLNVEKGAITDIWHDTYFAYTYDPDRHLLLVCGYTKPKTESEQPRSDLFSILLNGQRSKVSEPCFATAEYVGWKTVQFIGRGPDGVVAIDLHGKMSLLFKQVPERMSVSPDRKLVALYNNEEMMLVQEPGKVIRTIQLSGISNVLWAPKSNELWIDADTNYFFSIPDGNLTKLVCPLDLCWIGEQNHIWLP